MERPADMFDREWEWSALVRFASDPSDGATLGVVRGRRRQGKSFLLDALCEASGGFYYEALQGQQTEGLRHFGARLGTFTRAPGTLVFHGWEDAISALLDLGRDDPLVVVLDEFPYLAGATPQLPSIIQAAFGARAVRRRQSRTRLILCGSALSFMGRLLGGDAPLRGRAGLELPVGPFDHRTAAAFWGLAADPQLAFRVFAVVGGTAAYRREFVRGDAPASLADFDAWICRAVLDPSVPLFFEGRYLLAEDPGVGEVRTKALYHSVLAAIAEGHRTRGGIASYLGRRSPEIGHPLTVLEDAGLIRKSEDTLRSGRPRYDIAEPIVRFYHAIMRPRWGRLERPGAAAAVWSDASATFRAAVLGPAFEELCRAWTLRFAGPPTLAEPAVEVGQATVTDRRARRTHELDVVALGAARADGRRPLLLLGEAKYGRVMGARDVDRLHRIKGLLAERTDLDASPCRLACFSGQGFEAQPPGDEVSFIDVARLYREGA